VVTIGDSNSIPISFGVKSRLVILIKFCFVERSISECFDDILSLSLTLLVFFFLAVFLLEELIWLKFDKLVYVTFPGDFGLYKLDVLLLFIFPVRSLLLDLLFERIASQ
jgi:hypothetical protein